MARWTPLKGDAVAQAQNKGREGWVQVRGARQNNLKDVSLDIPRQSLVVFTGVSGSGKSSLAFGTLYAEAQRRYLESVSPYARRLFHQLPSPDVDAIDGLPPAVALQQQRGTPSTRSSVGSVTTLANLLRMLFSRAGDYPPGQAIVYADGFSPHTPAGACPRCQGLGEVHEVTEASMVPDPSLSIRERAVAAWPLAWGGQNLRDILTTLGHSVDTPWRALDPKVRKWILFTDEQPCVPVFPGFSVAQARRAQRQKQEPSYMGTFSSARRYVLHTYASTQSARNKARARSFLRSHPCRGCGGKRLGPAALSVRFAGRDIAQMQQSSIAQLQEIFAPFARNLPATASAMPGASAARVQVSFQIARDLQARLGMLSDLGLGYLDLGRTTPTLSAGELQRLRLATAVHSHLFGVVYVLDEPSAGLHPVDTEALLRALLRLKEAGNSLFVVEHQPRLIRRADWLVDLGPDAGDAGGEVLYNGPPAGLAKVAASRTRPYLSGKDPGCCRAPRPVNDWLTLQGLCANNLQGLDVALPLATLTGVCGVSGSGKSTLISQLLVDLVAEHLGQPQPVDEEQEFTAAAPAADRSGRLGEQKKQLRRLVVVDQKPIGRTPRSNLATYTGLFDHVRALFAQTPAAKARRLSAGHFSFNSSKGRCPTCVGEGAVQVELLFLPSVYSPCPDCAGRRYTESILAITYGGRNIADVLHLRVSEAIHVFEQVPAILRALTFLQEVGLGYLRLGQAATELSGGEAQRIKLAFELQRPARGGTLYILDEPTTGLHPADVDKLLAQLQRLVDAGNTVVVVEHDLRVLRACDWVIDMGPGAGPAGGKVVFAGRAQQLAQCVASRTAPYLAEEGGL